MVIMKTKKIKKPNAMKRFHKMNGYAHNVESDANLDEEEHEEVPKEIRIIAQEVHIVRSLACNDLNKRNRQMRKLRKWLQLRASSSFPFTEEDFLRIWKGLYYNMWMSDKPLVQEELSEQLAKLLECFNGDVLTSVKFFGAFVQIMCNEWFGIDQWRIDKFMMLVRRMLRYIFHVLKRTGWSAESIQLFNEHMKKSVLADESPAIGLTMHYLDIFFEELAKVSEGDISAEEVGAFVRPFVIFMGKQQDGKLISHCRTQVFNHLLYQSKLGREYSDKYNAWREMGFPTASIHGLEKIADDDGAAADNDEEPTEATSNDEQQLPLDPRAGNVDVFMPELIFDGKYVIEELERLLYKDEEITTKRRKTLRKLLDVFQKYQNGSFPLGIKRMPRFNAHSEQPLIRSKVDELENVENELFGVGRKLKQLNKRKRRKLLKSLNYENMDESNFDQTIMKSLPKQYLNERKRKAQAAMMTGWLEEEIDVDDVSPKKKAKKKKILQKQPSFKYNEEANASKESERQSMGVQQEASSIHDNTESEKSHKEKTLKSTPKKHKNIEAVNATPVHATKAKISNSTDVIQENESKENLKASLTQATIALTNETADGSRTKKEKTFVETTETPIPTTEKVNNTVDASKVKKNKLVLEVPETEITTNAKASSTPKLKKNKSALEVSEAVTEKTINSEGTPKVKKTKSGWETPLEEGEVEYFIPSRKIQAKKANSSLVLNPLAKKSTYTPVNSKSGTPKTSGLKRVKIALKHNTAQNPSEYIKQIKSSPNLPYDADKKPGKGLLKPNSMPSPINPFYKKKIGLRLLNDTM